MNGARIPPERDLPPGRRERIRRLLTVDEAEFEGRLGPRFLVPVLTAAAVVALVVGTTLAISLTDRGGPSGSQDPAPAPGPSSDPTWGPDNPAPLERCEVVDREECILIQQQLHERKLARWRSDSTPEERCRREIRRPSGGGSVDGASGGGSIDEQQARAVLTVRHGKGETIVFADGRVSIACDTSTLTPTLLQVRSLVPEPLDVSSLAISTNALTEPVDPWGPAWSSYRDTIGKHVNDYAFGVGRMTPEVRSLAWRFEYRDGSSRLAEAEVRDGYWVMQHLTEPRTFTRVTAVVRYDDGRTDEAPLFRSFRDSENVCAQINHGC